MLISFEEFKKTNEYNEFIKNNSEMGILKVMAFTAYQAIPIEGVEVLITKDFGNNKVLFYRGYTDSSGIIDNIMLPAPVSGYSLADAKISNYTLYDLTAIKSDYDTIKNYTIGMFGNIKVIQNIKMIPKVDLEEN